MMTWLAADNIETGTNMYSRELVQQARNDPSTANEALNNLTEAEEMMDLAANFASSSANLNPLLMPYARLIDANNQLSKLNLNTQRNELNNIANTFNENLAVEREDFERRRAIAESKNQTLTNPKFPD